MKARNLLILVVVAVVLAAVALMSHRDRRKTESAHKMGRKLIEQLDVNAVQRIVLTKPGGTVTVARVEGQWVAPDKFNYPVKFSTVKEFLLGLGDIKIGYEVPADTDQKSRLNLVPPGDAAAVEKGNAGTELKLYDAAGKTLTSLLIGKKIERAASGDNEQFGFGGGMPDGRYVADHEGRVYALSATMDNADGGVDQWLEKSIVNVGREEIVNLTRHSPTGDTLVVSRPAREASFAVQGLSTNQEVDTYKLDNLTGALAYLNFSEIADPSLSAEKTGLDAPVSFTARTDKGKVVTVSIGAKIEQGNKRYVRLTASYEPPPAPVAATGAVATAESTATNAAPSAEEVAKKAAEERAKLETEIKDLSTQFARWTYILDEYEVERMLTPREDLIKKPTPPPPPEGQGADTSAVPPALEPAPPPVAEAAPAVQTPAPATPADEGGADAATPAAKPNANQP